MVKEVSCVCCGELSAALLEVMSNHVHVRSSPSFCLGWSETFSSSCSLSSMFVCVAFMLIFYLQLCHDAQSIMQMTKNAFKCVILWFCTALMCQVVWCSTDAAKAYSHPHTDGRVIRRKSQGHVVKFEQHPTKSSPLGMTTSFSSNQDMKMHLDAVNLKFLQ